MCEANRMKKTGAVQEHSENPLDVNAEHPVATSPGSSDLLIPKNGSEVRGETRHAPVIPHVPPAPEPLPSLEKYESVIGKANMDELMFLAVKVKGKTVKMV